MPYHSSSKLFLALFEDFQIRVSDLGLDISTNRERKCNVILSPKFGCRQVKTNQILKNEAFVIV